MTAPLLVIAAGGTGGHMFPAQALAETMLARGWRVALSTDARGLRYAGGFPPEVERRETPSATFARGGLLARAMVPLAILRGALAAVARFRADRPAVVAGFGGYPSLPALLAAGLLGAPRLIHEQNGVPGRVNRRFARHVDAFAFGVRPAAAPPGARLVETGNPIRAAARAAAVLPYAPPTASGRLSLLAFGGSQGASAFARLLPEAMAALPAPLRARIDLTAQAREGEAEGLRAAVAALGVAAEVRPFFDDLPARIAAAQLVIARAGASTMAELGAIGRPAILIPYPAATDDHQTANARPFAEAGAAILAPEAGPDGAGLTGAALAGHIRAVLEEPARARAMAAAAKRLGRPDAAEALADLVARLAKGDAPA